MEQPDAEWEPIPIALLRPDAADLPPPRPPPANNAANANAVPQPPAIATTLRALRQAQRPSFYDDEAIFGANPTFSRACIHLILLSLFVSLPSTFVFVLRCSPALGSLHMPMLLDEAERVFPNGLEIVLNGSQLLLRPDPDAQPTSAAAAASSAPKEEEDDTFVCWSSAAEVVADQVVTPAISWCASAPRLEPIRMQLSTLLHDAFYTDLPRPLPIAPARLLSLRAGMGTLQLLRGRIEMMMLRASSYLISF